MALSISLTPHHEPDAVADASSIRIQSAHLIFDSSYPSGGYSVSPSRFGFQSRLFDVVATGAAAKRYYFGVNYDPIAGTLRVFSIPSGTGAWTEVTATASVLAGVIVRAIAIGY